ncbi:leucine-rich repeat-containing G-protein coupled receptor 5-like [Xenentodon cancila]
MNSVPVGCFSGLKSLRYLWLDDKALTEVPVAALKDLPALQLKQKSLLFSLLWCGRDLSYNHIQILPSFSSCQNIHNIDLQQNHIQELNENTFTGLASLRSLDLSWNRLSSVKPNSFYALPALTKLDLSSNQLSSLLLNGLQSLTDIRLAGNNRLMELIRREDLPRVRVMELPYAFQRCAFYSSERTIGGLSWKEEAGEPLWGDTPVLSSPVDPYWDKFQKEFEDEPKPQHSVHCTPSPGLFHPCLHLLGSWMIRGGVWLIAAVSLVVNTHAVLSVFFSPASLATPPKLLIGLLALVNGLMGVWSSWLVMVDAWTFGSFWRYAARWESSFLCGLSSFLFGSPLHFAIV